MLGPREPYHCDLLPSPCRLARNVLSHATGLTPDGIRIVVDVWSRRRPSTGFLANRLGRCSTGGWDVAPDVTPFQVYNTFTTVSRRNGAPPRRRRSAATATSVRVHAHASCSDLLRARDNPADRVTWGTPGNDFLTCAID
jgi:hypothetical protein